MKQDVENVIKSHTELNSDEYFMQEALKEANLAYLENEVPVGCVVVRNKTIIARSHNTRDKEEDIFGHAEIKALKEASNQVGSWILDDVSVYVTLEPCFMCAGALLQARVKKIVFAASEPKHGAIGSITNIFELPNINHHPEIIKGINEIEASTLLKQFFKDLREKRKSK